MSAALYTVAVLYLCIQCVLSLDCPPGKFYESEKCVTCTSGFYCTGCEECNDDWNTGRVECPSNKAFSNTAADSEQDCGVCAPGTMYLHSKEEDGGRHCVPCPGNNGYGAPMCPGCKDCLYPHNRGMECPPGTRFHWMGHKSVQCLPF